MSLRPTILIVDDDPAFLGALARSLRPSFEVTEASVADSAREQLIARYDVVIVDLRLDAGDTTNKEGLSLLDEITTSDPSTPVIVMTAFGDVATAVDCMRRGAWDFVQKEGTSAEICARIEKAIQQASLRRRVDELERDLEIVAPRAIVGKSAAMKEVKRQIVSASEDGNITVLLRGETGTGKEVVARAIHASGPRAEMPFVAVDTAALHGQTFVSELFGHEAGAFTDAKQRHIGHIERARGGVLFLDEIGDISLEIQKRFLRFLEEKTIMRLGGSKEHPVDVQVVAATNADLDALASEGSFRKDLLYRLKVFELHLPPLRDRQVDIPELCEFFLHQFSARWKGAQMISPEALQLLNIAPWHGNVRQLKNVVEAARLRAQQNSSRVILPKHLPPDLLDDGQFPITSDAAAGQSLQLDLALARRELEVVQTALRHSGGIKSEAVKVLGLNDRFALPRRVKAAFRKYPDLVSEYYELALAFGVTVGSRTTGNRVKGSGR